MTSSRFGRRELLATAATTAAVWSTSTLMATGAQAIGPAAEVTLGVIQHGGTWNHRPEAIRRLLWETGKRTSIQVGRDRVVVSLDDDGSAASRALFWQPLLVLAGEGPMPPFSAMPTSASL